MIELECARRKPAKPLERCEIRIVRHSWRMLDFDGLVGSVKPVIDALVSAGVLMDDAWNVTGPWIVDQVFRPKSQGPLLEIEVIERPAKELLKPRGARCDQIGGLISRLHETETPHQRDLSRERHAVGDCAISGSGTARMGCAALRGRHNPSRADDPVSDQTRGTSLRDRKGDGECPDEPRLRSK